MEAIAPRLLLFDRRSETERQKQLAQKTDERVDREDRILCARCQHAITRQSERTVVQGNHEHTFTNPAGITFHIGCFREAPGCATSGAGTMEYTWFTGYEWRIAVCNQCETQLGWQFSSSADSFFGLITNRLM